MTKHKMTNKSADSSKRASFEMLDISGGESVSIYQILGDRTVTLNVGGVIHQTYYRTLARWPSTRLFRLAYQQALHPITETQEFFFDRDPSFFSAVLDFYRNGWLHLFAYTFVTETQTSNFAVIINELM